MPVKVAPDNAAYPGMESPEGRVAEQDGTSEPLVPHTPLAQEAKNPVVPLPA